MSISLDLILPKSRTIGLAKGINLKSLEKALSKGNQALSKGNALQIAVISLALKIMISAGICLAQGSKAAFCLSNSLAKVKSSSERKSLAKAK